MIKSKRIAALLSSAVILASVAGCTPANNTTTAAGTTAAGTTAAGTTAAGTTAAGTTAAGTTAAGTTAPGPNQTITGKIETDGSSTVYPLSEAVIEEAATAFPKLTVTASPSGSSAGIERLINGEIDIAASSRGIKAEELATAKSKGVDVLELQVGIDGIAVVASKNSPVSAMTFEELQKIFAKDATIKKWNEANPAFPDVALSLFSPGTSSGTYEYFTDHVLKTKNEQRAADVQVSEDDNVLVTGIAGSPGGLGYFGFTYYEENMDTLKAMSLNGVEATKETILDGTYPLARPIFLYVNSKSVVQKPEVKAFLEFYLDNAITLAEEINMVPATPEIIAAAKKALAEAK